MTKSSDQANRPGNYFQQATKYLREEMGGIVGAEPRAEPYKVYRSALEVIALPPADSTGGGSLWAAIQKRRSVRRYAKKPLTLREVTQLLWASQGITSEAHGLRAAPSAGALYPIETYLMVNNVDGLKPGVYHYRVLSHALEFIRDGAFGQDLAEAAVGQAMCAAAPVVFVWTAIIQRSSWRYKQRAYRYIYLDAGHIAAHVSLAAVALGLGTCQIAAFFDKEVDAVVQVDGELEFTVYMTSVGRS